MSDAHPEHHFLERLPPLKLCQNWLRHWRGTLLYFRAASSDAVSALRKVWVLIKLQALVYDILPSGVWVLITLRASLPGTFLQKEGCRKPMPLGVWVLIRLWKRPNTHVNMKRVRPGKKKKKKKKERERESSVSIKRLWFISAGNVGGYERNDRYNLTAQQLCESRGGRPGLSVLTSLMVSVDVKQY